jgi:hypothetical protein
MFFSEKEMVLYIKIFSPLGIYCDVRRKIGFQAYFIIGLNNLALRIQG